jgi:CHAT domain-containing protein
MVAQKKLKICLAFFTIFILSGCASEFSMHRTMAGAGARYGDLAAHEESQIKERGETTAALYNLCSSYLNLRVFSKLSACLDRMEARIQKGDKAIVYPNWIGETDGTPALYNMRAEASLELGRYQEAFQYAELAYKGTENFSNSFLANEKSMHALDALEKMVLAKALDGDKEQAAKYEKILESYDIGIRGRGIVSPRKSAALARANIALGRYERALANIQDGAGAWVGIGKVLSLGMMGYVEIPFKFMEAMALMETGKASQAKSIYDELLGFSQIKDNSALYRVALFQRGRIAESEGDLKSAIGFYRQAVDVIEQQRATLNTEASKIGFVGDKQDVYKRLIATLIKNQQFAEAFDYLERSKSRALVDMLASKNDFAVHEGDAAKVSELLAKAEQTEMDGPAQGGAPAGTDSQAASSVPASGQRSLAVSAVKKAITETAPEVASLVSVSSTPIEEIQARIPADETLVEYYYDDSSLFIFLLSRQGLQVLRTDTVGLDAEVKALRDVIAAPKSNAYLPIAQQLYSQLIKPIEPLLAGRSKLIIVPQGALHYVPFAALHDGSRFLLDKYAFRLLPSASVVKYLRGEQSRKPGGILAFGNPDLGDPKYDLKFAEEEAKAIIQTVPKSHAVLRKDATEAALRENAAGFNYLHFATHGEFNADAPLNSALILAKDASSDGLLTVGKLYSMRLDIDLATLSACETGLGKVANGDDVVGLTRGFLFAGASTIVASLWQVDDRATSELMRQFYEGLKSMDKREALRQAQIYARDKYAHPYYWAAFQLTGNSQ